MKKKKYLPLYYKFINQGHLCGYSGLCLAFDFNGLPYREVYNKFLTEDEQSEFAGCYFEPYVEGKFTPLRQNIVLLCFTNGRNE